MQTSGLVVPTIFSRPSLLPLALASIRQSNDTYVLLSSPPLSQDQTVMIQRFLDEGLIDEVIVEPTSGNLSSKIQHAIDSLPLGIQYVGWLGDDDLLTPNAIGLAVAELEKNRKSVLVYGNCQYIDAEGRELFLNTPGMLGAKILGWGPQLIPQPGALWRRDTFDAIGGLSADLEMAFDYDLFLRLKAAGDVSYIPETLASFRWHADSLSVKRRWKSASEASTARRRNRHGLSRILLILEPAVIFATWLAGKLVTAFRSRSTR